MAAAKRGFPVRFGASLAAAALVCWSVAALAADLTPQADDKCVEQCDAASDQCMADADGDADKEKACDTKYDECLRKCG
ncbi:MAG: hypothetical protein O9284_16820 [Steroidobacteraceae bacterium]|jgi:hypothetical protein|nr:hypothetical protein [Steroidobacteraceae bacterium]